MEPSILGDEKLHAPRSGDRSCSTPALWKGFSSAVEWKGLSKRRTAQGEIPNMSSEPVVTALSRGPCPSFHLLSARYLDEYCAKIRVVAEELDEDQLWWRPAEGTNSVGNLLLHLVGNLSLWILQGVGGETYERDRAGEFAASGGPGREELLSGLESVVARCREVLERDRENSLDRQLDIQGYSVDARGAMFHAVEHMGYHTGQIVWAVKLLLGSRHGIEFYPRHSSE